VRLEKRLCEVATGFSWARQARMKCLDYPLKEIYSYLSDYEAKSIEARGARIHKIEGNN
jgi:hypothetical protein